MSDFFSEFWGYWVAGIVVLSLVWLTYLLISQSVVKLPKGQQADVTGHKWDGDLEEYNNPLPMWWMGLFYLTIIFAVVYLALYPGLGAYQGSKGWTAVGQYEQESAAKDKDVKPLYDKYLKVDVATLAKDPAAQKSGQSLFLTYCMQCHGSDARGAKGFPNLTDADWLYGGKPEQILETLNAGRAGQMPAFGVAFGEEKVKDVANYVQKLASKKYDAVRAARGQATYQQVCVACHQADGKGSQLIGAPNLTDTVWLYGGSERAITETITNGRKNRMPAWKEALGEGKVHLLAAYVYGLSDKPEAGTKP
ncbi:cytochrome-c oxidase, cbb3-type subunit III [Chitinimonas viridis]|uniref:Cbb3-type cytochrome c oxidase subunit n=1 Tax=Chitinimonas viridis TaxID=664880 RepID=A0ABT8B5S1_9NEIS|nr:cytochrome-c oxidase, cbb3-type subunit III [Chitinimonas viridis]MDN3577016.1 cytochrome-c oxidase, cbb3-type subunit III [Chitinimonas viridis]